MKAIGFYAGGVATVFGGLWVAYTKLRGGKNDNAQERPKPNNETNISSTGGIAGGRDVSIGGNASFSQTPRAAWMVLGLGIACLALVAVFGGDTTTITNGVQIGGSVENSTITIGE